MAKRSASIFSMLLVIVSVIGLAYVSAQVNIGETPSVIEGVIIESPTTAVGGGNVSFNATFGDGRWLKLDTSNDPLTDILTVQGGNGRIVSTNAGGTIRIDTSGGAKPGYISFGNTADIGISTDGTVSGYNYDGTLVTKQKASNPSGEVEFLWIEEAGSWRYAIPGSGTDLATGNPRSFIIGYGAKNNASDVYCSHNGFDMIDCDTSGTGGDLGVADDIQALGNIYGNGSGISDINGSEIVDWIKPDERFGLMKDNMFGTGTDGDVVISTLQEIQYTNKYYNNLTINADRELKFRANYIFVNGTLHVSGNLSDSGVDGGIGGDGTGAGGGAKGTKGDYPTSVSKALFTAGGQDGHQGGLGGTPGNPGSNCVPGFVSSVAYNGNIGGDGSDGCSGGTSGGTACVNGPGWVNHQAFLTSSPGVYGGVKNVGGTRGGGGGGGGGDAGAGGGGGGGSGSGASQLVIFARHIVVDSGGYIKANGGDGGDGGDGFGSAGGGGAGAGGGGGFVYLVYETLDNSGTIQAVGGKGGDFGSGGGTCPLTDAQDGADGFVYAFDLRTGSSEWISGTL